MRCGGNETTPNIKGALFFFFGVKLCVFYFKPCRIKKKKKTKTKTKRQPKKIVHAIVNFGSLNLTKPKKKSSNTKKVTTFSQYFYFRLW